jgi:hypothetical protein
MGELRESIRAIVNEPEPPTTGSWGDPTMLFNWRSDQIRRIKELLGVPD